jgi:hypothetical protein
MKRNESRAVDLKVGESLGPLFGPHTKPNSKEEPSNRLEIHPMSRNEKTMMVSMKQRLKEATEQLKNKRLNGNEHTHNESKTTSERPADGLFPGKFTFRNIDEENNKNFTKKQKFEAEHSAKEGALKGVDRELSEEDKENRRNAIQARDGSKVGVNGPQTSWSNKWLKRAAFLETANNSQISNKPGKAPSGQASVQKLADTSFDSKANPTLAKLFVQPFDSRSRTISAEASLEQKCRRPGQQVDSVSNTLVSNLESFDNLSSIQGSHQKRLEITKANCQSACNNISIDSHRQAQFQQRTSKHYLVFPKCGEPASLGSNPKLATLEGSKPNMNPSNGHQRSRVDHNNTSSNKDLVRSGKEMFREWGKQLQLFQQKQLDYLAGKGVPRPGGLVANSPAPASKETEKASKQQRNVAAGGRAVKAPAGSHKRNKAKEARKGAQARIVSEKGSVSMVNIFQETPRNAIQITEAVTATPTFFFEQRDCRSHSPSQYQSPGANKHLVSFPTDVNQFENGLSKDTYFSNLMKEFKLNSAYLKEFASAPLSPRGRDQRPDMRPEPSSKDKKAKLMERLASGVPEKVDRRAMRELSRRNYGKLAEVVEREREAKKREEAREGLRRRQEYDKVETGHSRRLERCGGGAPGRPLKRAGGRER